MNEDHTVIRDTTFEWPFITELTPADNSQTSINVDELEASAARVDLILATTPDVSTVPTVGQSLAGFIQALKDYGLSPQDRSNIVAYAAHVTKNLRELSLESNDQRDEATA